MTYDPHSTDAMFSRILERLDAQDVTLHEIREGVRKMNGRVSGLERWRDIITAKTAGLALTVSTLVGILGWYFQR